MALLNAFRGCLRLKDDTEFDSLTIPPYRSLSGRSLICGHASIHVAEMCKNKNLKLRKSQFFED